VIVLARFPLMKTWYALYTLVCDAERTDWMKWDVEISIFYLYFALAFLGGLKT